MNNWILLESFAVFTIWMQRKGRWALFLKSMGGEYTVAGSPNATTTPVNTTSKSGKSTTATPVFPGNPTQTKNKKTFTPNHAEPGLVPGAPTKLYTTGIHTAGFKQFGQEIISGVKRIFA